MSHLSKAERQAVHCINPTLARGEAARKSELFNAEKKKKSKDRDGKDITQDGHKYIKACFSFFYLQIIM